MLNKFPLALMLFAGSILLAAAPAGRFEPRPQGPRYCKTDPARTQVLFENGQANFEVVCGKSRGAQQAAAELAGILDIDNAIKYSTEGARISLMLIRQGRSVVISAKNPSEATGEEQLFHVFDRFWRADPSRSSAVSGHGIGLSVAKAITESHNGKIKAYIDEQGSFTVTVTLPEGSKV